MAIARRIFGTDFRRLTYTTYASAGYVACMFFVLYAALGAWFSMYLHIYIGDALARTALASYVIQGRQPHLAAIGFVWNPIPSVLEIPFVLLLHLFGLQQLAGPAVSALAGALCVHTVFQCCRHFEASIPFSLALTVAFALNPMMLLYSANGMSETSLMCCILWSALQTVRWVDNRKLAHRLGMATGIALATWVRYEALPLIAAVIASILVTAIIDKRESWTAVRVQGTILAVVVPAFYSVGLWILFNGLIMGDPFYFLRSEYSNSAQTATFRTNPNYQQLGYHDVVHAIAYSVRRLTLVSLWYLPFAILVLIASIQTGRASTISLFVISAAVPTFHIALLYMGSSYGWLRFFIYAWPFSVIFAAILYADYERWTQRFPVACGSWHRLIRRTSHMLPLFMVMLLVVGDVIAGVAMARPDVGREEHAFVEKMLRPSTILENNRSFAAEADVTRYLDNNVEGLVLIDSSTGFPIPLASMHPEQFVINSDIEFQRAVVAPYLYVQRLLVPAPVGIFKSDTLNLHYPDLYEGRLPWAVLEKEFGTHNEWRLYRVIALSPR